MEKESVKKQTKHVAAHQNDKDNDDYIATCPFCAYFNSPFFDKKGNLITFQRVCEHWNKYELMVSQSSNLFVRYTFVKVTKG